ncbi:MAG: AAA family ATPase [Myxococcota bacterium]
MKILAIRGRNLASLDGDFEVDLADGALGRVGLFAITGPTGAGKSTLLDAVCLALFDKTPRFSERGGVPVGHPGQDEELRVAAHDVRNLLRRGTGEGFAEVDFRGRDGRRYRARWSVRRANKKPGRRLQNQDVTLVDLETDRRVGRTKTDALEAIEDRLGLTFDQFRRSALLAQGDFAAFLKAKDDDRAELLERMTGTDIFQRISRAAYERSKAEHKRVEDVEQRQRDLGVLASEDREALEAELAEEEHAFGDARTTTQALEAHARWYAERAELRAKAEEGEREVDAAEEAWQYAAARREELQRMRAVEPLRAHIEGVDRAEVRLAEARKRAEEAVDRAERARTAAETAKAARQAAVKAEEEARGAQKEAGPALDRAKALDRKLEEAGQAVRQATERRAGRAKAAEEASGKEAGLRERLRGHRQAEEEAATWLAEHEHVAPVARAWTACEQELRRVEAALRDRKSAEAEAERLEAALQTAEAEAKRTAGAAKEAEDALAAAKEARERAEGEASAVSGEALREERRGLEEQGERARRALAAAEQATTLAAERDRAEKAAREHREAAKAARKEAEEARAEGERLATVVEERARAARRAEAARSHDEERQELREGEPCPLCGSEDHPWAKGTPMAGLLDGLRRDEETARREQTEAQAHAEAAGERARQADERAEEQEEAAGDRRDRLAEQVDAWRDVRSEDLPAEPTEGGALDAARAWRRDVAKRLEDLAAREEALERLRAAAEEKRRAFEAARQGRDEALERSRRADRALRELEAALEEARGEAARAGIRRKEAMEALEAYLSGFPGWETTVATNPDGFRLERKREVEAYAEQDKRRGEAREAAGRLEPRVAEAAAEAKQAAERRDEAEIERRDADQALAGLKEERGGLLGGRATEEVERALEQAATDAEAKRKQADEEAGRAQEEHAAARTAREEAAEQVGARERELKSERDALAARLAERGLAEEEARERLARDPEAVEREAKALADLDKRRDTAHAVAKERKERLAEHEKAGHPEATEEEVRERLEAARKDLEAAEERVQERRVRLKQDDDARERAKALEEERAARQEVAERWGRLTALIGSADGKVFRKFAQGLTLRALLDHANRQLDDLAPRYRLQQVPGHDLELQVLDREMGDEVRSIHSLSGGETFLVSLALALGLASLASTDTPVESLFIDEGFGTLDRETLEVALAALDALQAGGRQVGVISHVEGLAEHIGARIHVDKRGGGRSRVSVQGLAVQGA